ncbi:hypothetical protein AB0E69_33215 [Kribbella sp. NPDC026611]|uniref:hypothetical protein n=1 Tax=Kribbella sp. NPDC026611 TaxID=3154911 RepID=UPI0033CF1019
MTTADVPEGSADEGIVGWSSYDEYGNATGASSDTGRVDYSWLGAIFGGWLMGAGLGLLVGMAVSSD